MAGSVGTTSGTGEGGPTTAFPQVDFSGLDFERIDPKFVKDYIVPFVDTIKRMQEVGTANQNIFQNNLGVGSENALRLTQLEFQGLQDFNRQARALQQEGITQENSFNRGAISGANQFNVGQVSGANRFNQQERLKQLEFALPGARDVIQKGIERGAQLSEGRFATDAEDRAFEVAARSAGADSAAVRGFGADSAFGKRTSELLSAQQRLQLSQVGDQTTDRFLRLGGTLAFDQPIKFNPVLQEPQQARTSQDVRGAPSVPASQLAVQQQQELNGLTTVTPAQAIGFDINQNQFQANTTVGIRKFNSNLDFEAQKFNSTQGLAVDLEKLAADAFNAQQQAGAMNSANESQTAQDQFNSAQSQGEHAANLGAIGQIGGALITGAAAVLPSLLKSAGAGGAETALETAGATAATPAALSLGGAGAAGAASAAIPAGTVELAGGTLSLPAGAAIPSGYAAVGSSISGGTLAVPTAGTGIATEAGTTTVAGGTGTAGASGISSFALPVAGAALAADVLFNGGHRSDIQNTAEGAASGAAIGSAVPGIGTAIGAGVGAAAGFIRGKLDSVFGGGKPEAQQERDQLRDLGADLGAFTKVDGAHQVKLASGANYNIGVDGGAKLENHGTNIDGKTERNTYDVDWSDPRAKESVGLLNPVAFMLFGENSTKMMGHMWNAATSDNRTLSGTKDNIRQFANNAGINYQTGLSILRQYKDSKDSQGRPMLNEPTYLSFVNGWNDLMLAKGVKNEISV